MNFCDKCKVNIESGVHHCPLCGRSVDNTPNESNITRFPDYTKFYKHRLHITTVLARILVVLALLSVIINFIVPFTSFWSGYILACVFWVIIGVLIPTRYRMSLSAQTKFQIFGISAVVVVAEVLTNTFGWGVGYVIPFVLLAYAIVCSIMLIVKGYVNFDYFLPMAFIAFCSILLYVLNKFVFKLEIWPALLPLCLSLLVILFLFVFRFKRTIKCIKKYWKI